MRNSFVSAIPSSSSAPGSGGGGVRVVVLAEDGVGEENLSGFVGGWVQTEPRGHEEEE